MAANCYFKMGQYERAIFSCDVALDSQSLKQIKILKIKMMSLTKLQRNTEALHVAQTILEQDSRHELAIQT